MSPLLAALLALSSAAPGVDEPSVRLIQSGAGFLVAKSRSIVILELELDGPEGPVSIERPRVRAALGKVHAATVVGPGRLRFGYEPPARVADRDTIDYELRAAGRALLGSLPIPLLAGPPPGLSLLVQPTTLPPGTVTPPIDVEALLSGPGALGLAVESSAGERFGASEAERSIAQRIDLAGLPNDRPSLVTVLAVGATSAGFAATAVEVQRLAEVPLSAAIPAGAELGFEGTEVPVRPVIGRGDGRTSARAVVRYGRPITAIVRAPSERPERAPVEVPTGDARPALVAIPGQAIADGGAGPTFVLAVPPDPDGRRSAPAVTVEGAELIEAAPLGPGLHALVLRRPATPETVFVSVLGVTFERELAPGRGRSVELTPVPTQAKERAAVLVSVLDAGGRPTPWPPPTIEVDGESPRLSELRPGVVRLSLPASFPGDEGARVAIRAAIPPAPLLVGDAQEVPSATLEVALEGRPEVIVSPSGVLEPTPVEAPSVRARWLGLGAHGFAALTLGPRIGGGVALQAEARLPLWAGRPFVRVGLEWARAEGERPLALGPRSLVVAVRQQSLALPLDVGLRFEVGAGWWLGASAGVAASRQAVQIEHEGFLLPGGEGWVIGARAAVEAGVDLGPFELSTRLGAADLGADASALRTPEAELRGSLGALRFELGLKVWP